MATTTVSSGSIGVDYSFARPDPTALASAGVKFVCRYLADLPNSKVIDAAERDSLWSAGLGILLNWEQSAGDFLIPSKGESQGAEAAKQATALGYPTDLPIVVSCDSDAATSSQQEAAGEYFTNFNSGAGAQAIGVYAQAQVANLLLGKGLVNFVWAPNATSWNQGVSYQQLDVQQHYGESDFPTLAQFGDSIDPDTAAQDFAVWSGAGGSSSSTTTSSTTSTTTASTASSGGSYTVKSGDSWWGIAQTQLGSGTLDTQLAAVNGKTLDDPIYPGDVLQLP